MALLCSKLHLFDAQLLGSTLCKGSLHAAEETSCFVNPKLLLPSALDFAQLILSLPWRRQSVVKHTRQTLGPNAFWFSVLEPASSTTSINLG